MNYSVRILPQARRDIERNEDWWAETHSIEQALRWSGLVHDQLETLREMPLACALSPENDQFRYELRDKLIGAGSTRRFRPVFTIKDEDVFVLAVRAAQQDCLHPDDIEY